MATPNGTTIIARTVSGDEVDVTEGMQVLYDGVIQSMDWGSGFWTIEDAIPVARVAEICGFKGCEETERYLRERRRKDLLSKLVREGMPFGHAINATKRAFPDPFET